MIQLKPQEFFDQFEFTFEPKKHHFTGPQRYHQPEGHGAVWYEEGKVLANFAKQIGGPVLEIGTNLAISTRFISEGLDAHGGDGKVWTIDIDQWWVYTKDWPRIIPFCMDSRYFPVKPFKWAFVDGDHTYEGVKQDLPLVHKCKCEVIVFHDAKTWPGVKKAVEEGLSEDQWNLVEVDTGCGLIVAVHRDQA